MKFRLTFILVFLLFFATSNAQHKRAFLVGISHYDTALTGYQWNDINGVEDINLIYPSLKKQGYVITKVLDGEATYKNITQQLTSFVNSARKGDVVYLHFSTHGQPIEDLNGDEDDGWDEAIVPIDAYKIYKKGTYEGGKHLTDDLLNTYIKKLRSKIGPTGFLYVVIDACHAGTASRANDESIRGTHVGFSANNKIFRPSQNKSSHYHIFSSTKLADVMFIEACRADQVNREIKVGTKRYGPLSYNIAQVLQSFPLNGNAKEFLNRLKKSILQEGHWPNNQNLVIETSF